MHIKNPFERNGILGFRDIGTPGKEIAGFFVYLRITIYARIPILRIRVKDIKVGDRVLDYDKKRAGIWKYIK